MATAIRVLYVDDELDLLEISKLFLEASGDFSVATIESAPAALEILKTEQFDAIISDYQMPGMDGIQFLVEVRKNFDKIPFILFTGRGREEIFIQAINKGADFYLQKVGEPQSQFAELSHKIRIAVERHTADKAFNDSENRYHSLVNTMHDCVAVYRALADGEDFEFIEFNKAAEKSENISRKEVIGRRVTEVFPGVREFGLLDVFRCVWNTGLGLALSREILDITGIAIKETGEPGKGARFEMTMPKGMWRTKINGTQ
jgi:CheY-like chemotaxis protein